MQITVITDVIFGMQSPINMFYRYIPQYLIRSLQEYGIFVNVLDYRNTIINSEHIIFAPVIFGSDMYPNTILSCNYMRELRKKTSGKISAYCGARYKEGIFPAENVDMIFIMCGKSSPPKYEYVGIGIDQKLFHPVPKEHLIMWESTFPGCSVIEDTPIISIMAKFKDASKIKIVTQGYTEQGLSDFTIPLHSSIEKIAQWTNKSKFVLDTRKNSPGPGLNRYEAGCSGALLVIHKSGIDPDVHPYLPHVIWNTEEDLINILKSSPDAISISHKSSIHNWTSVIKRIVEALSK